MINFLFGYAGTVYRSIFKNERKRGATDVIDSQPPQKVVKYDHFETEAKIPAMSSDTKENKTERKSEEEISIIGEVPRKFASPRRALRPVSWGPHTSTPMNKLLTRRSSSNERQQVVDLTGQTTSGAAAVSTSDNDVQVIRAIRHLPIQMRGGAFGKFQTLSERPSKQSQINKTFRRNIIYPNRHARGELEQYRQLIDRYQYMYLAPFTIPKIKAMEGPPRKIDVIDLTQDVRVNRTNEQRPSSSSRLALEKIENAASVEEAPIARVNSLKDFIMYHPSAVMAFRNIPETLLRYKNSMKEKKKMAELEETKLNVSAPHNKKVIHAALEERMRDYCRLSEPAIIEVEDEAVVEYILPELSDEQTEQVSKALRPSPPAEVLAEKFGLSITRRDMHTLKGLNWLNDEVINYYMNLLIERGKSDSYPTVYAFNTFFFPKLLSGGHSSLKRWTRKVDLFSYEMICIPIHLGMHWCMCVVDFGKKEVRYYDSIVAPNDRCLQAVMEYLKAESLDKKKTPFDDKGWELINVEDIPRQMNGSDCGVFACTIAEHIARNTQLLFSQENMSYFRQKMVVEILNGALIT